MERKKTKRILINPRAKRILQMVNEPSDDDSDPDDVRPYFINNQNRKNELLYSRTQTQDTDQNIDEVAGQLRNQSSDQGKSEKSHKYDLRDVASKPYQDVNDNEGDFSPDASEYVPSPHRNSSENECLSSLGEENIPPFLNMQDLYETRTPSTISNLSAILENNYASNGSKTTSNEIDVDKTLRPQTGFLDSDLCQPLPTEINKTLTPGDTVEQIEQFTVEITVEKTTTQSDMVKDIPTSTIELNNISDATSLITPDNNQSSASGTGISPDMDFNTYTTAAESLLTRKRKINKNDWQDTINKNLKTAGKAYIGCRSKKQFDKKKVGPVCKCNLKCGEKFTPQSRQAIFDMFYSLESHESQWQFLIKYVRSQNIKKMQLERKNNRTQTLQYTLPFQNSAIRVCKVFFLNTLHISDQVVYTALQKYDSNPKMVDCRGKHSNRPHKMSETTEKNIITHIQQFPVKEAHYVRKSSQKKYLSETLNISKMYRLYTEWFNEQRFNDIKMATKRQYETIFNTKFNYSFFRPKKDQCARCVAYEQADEETKRTVQEEHNKHLTNKTRVREIKKKEKERAEENTCIAIFDMEKVLSVPRSEVGIFFYKRKYPVYNFTVFDSLNLKGYCYMWHLIIAKRGAVEIGSCLLQFIKEQHTKGITKISFYSDGCSGQNKNRYVFALYMYAAKKFEIEITHRFFETGHSESEGDSMHSCIERALKNKVLYTPDQMYSVVTNAKVSGKKYSVKGMEQADFYDIKSLINGKNWLTDTNGTKVKWSKIKELKVSYTDPDTIHLKYDYDGDCMTLKTEKISKSSSKRKSVPDTNVATTSCGCVELQQAYTSPIPVPKALYADLMHLCRSQAIPKNYHTFYNSLICQNEETQREAYSDTDISD